LMAGFDQINDLGVDWSAVAAIGTVCLALVAGYAATVAVYAPRWQRRRNRSEATAEVLSATREAILLFDEAKMVFARASWRDAPSAVLAARADHLHMTLDRLLNRPELTDGAIVAGSGAMRLLEAIMQGRDMIFSGNGGAGFGKLALEVLFPVDPIVPVVEDRAIRVARHAVRWRWPRWRKRFSAIADQGIRA
jgi:hypothetical protein